MAIRQSNTSKTSPCDISPSGNAGRTGVSKGQFKLELDIAFSLAVRPVSRDAEDQIF
jgi:hypothetical protein